MFDEIEKAHPEVFNVLLQVLNDGRLTRRAARSTSGTVLIMTLNVGSQLILERAGAGDWSAVEATVTDELRRAFRPEFLNRVDDIIVFRPLEREQLERIVELQLRRVEKLLAERELQLEVSDAARGLIAEEGYDARSARGRSSGRSSGWCRIRSRFVCSRASSRPGRRSWRTRSRARGS